MYDFIPTKNLRPGRPFGQCERRKPALDGEISISPDGVGVSVSAWHSGFAGFETHQAQGTYFAEIFRGHLIKS